MQRRVRATQVGILREVPNAENRRSEELRADRDRWAIQPHALAHPLNLSVSVSSTSQGRQECHGYHQCPVVVTVLEGIRSARNVHMEPRSALMRDAGSRQC